MNSPAKKEIPITNVKTTLEIQREQNEAALTALLSGIPEGPDGTEEIPVDYATGQVLAREVTAVMDEPPYSKSTANGFVFLPWGTALASPRNPLTFEVIGEMPSPAKPIELPTGKALRVKKDEYMSIRRFLEGNYTVLPESDEVRERDNCITVTRFLEKHENILVQGSRWKNGNILLEKGHRIQTADLFLLASQAIIKVIVGKPPTVGIFSCGEELLSPTEPYRIGYKYDCNAYGLAGMIRDAGGAPLFCGILQNQLNSAAKKLKDVIERKEIHMVVISGGSSEREKKFAEDLLKTTGITGESDPAAIVEALKWAVLAAETIWPCALGILKGKPVVCLSGNPQEAVRGFQLFAEPVIARLLGEKRKVAESGEAS